MEGILKCAGDMKRSELKKLVDARVKEFKEMGSRSNNELFKELCFCILTANFNAEKSIKIQKGIEDGFITLTESQLAKKLRGFGHRYPEARAKYIVEARKYQSSLKDVINSFKNEIDLREWIVKNIKGLGYKEASLPYHEKILVIIDGEVNLIEMGELFHQYNKGKLKGKKIQTFSFNPIKLKFEVAPVTNIMRHVYKKGLYKIHLKLGRNVSVTGDHSVFTFDGKNVLPIEVRKLKVGDFLAIPRKFPVVNSIDKELNIVDEFIKRDIIDKIYIRSKEYCNFLRENYKTKISRRNQYTQHFRGIIPLRIVSNLPKKTYSNDILKRFKVKISFRTSPNSINSIIKLNKDFFWIIGLLIAEASVSKNPIEITLGLEEYKRFLKLNNLLSDVFGITVKKYKPRHRNVYILKVHNLGFFYLIRNVLEITGTSTSKEVPKIVFSANFSNIISFLQGYWEGDGWKKSKSYFSVSTNSNELANGLLLILLMVGVVARFCKKKSRGFKFTISNTIDFSGIIQPSQLESEIPTNKTEVIPNTGNLIHDIHKKLKIKTKIDGKHTILFNKVMRWKHINQPSREKLIEFINKIEKHGSCEELEKLKTIVNSDLSFVQVKKIEKMPYKKKYVYDIEVAEINKNFQNFVGGFGGICLHNSHFMRNIGFDNFAIIDFHIIDILEKYGLIKRPKTLTRKKYLEIENVLKKIAKELDLSLAELDLYLWCAETGKILK